MRYHLFQKFFGKMVKIKETSFLSTRGVLIKCRHCKRLETLCFLLRLHFLISEVDNSKLKIKKIRYKKIRAVSVSTALHQFVFRREVYLRPKSLRRKGGGVEPRGLVHCFYQGYISNQILDFEFSKGLKYKIQRKKKMFGFSCQKKMFCLDK